MFCTGIRGEVVSGRKIFLGTATPVLQFRYIDLTWLVIGQWEHSKLGFPLNILYIFIFFHDARKSHYTNSRYI